MSRIAWVFGPGLLLSLLGCTSTRWGFVKPDRPTGGGVGSPEVQSVAALVDYLNDNSRRIQSVRVDDLDLTCSQGSQSFGLRGQMVTQKPRGFRMGAKALGSPVVDLGSNEQEFWYWISKADPPYQVYCSYKDLAEGRVRRMPFPFQPEWVMESMGLGPYGPAEKYRLEHDADSLRLIEKTTSPQGTAVRKVIVMKRRPMQPPHPQVTAFLLVDDASGKEICAAHIGEIQIDRGTGAIVPRKLELRWPAEKLKLSMRLDSTSVNPQIGPAAFQRRQMDGIQSFNLARMQVDNTPPPQAFSGLDSRVKTVQGP